MNITSNLNVASNLNVTSNLNVPIIYYKNTNKDLNLSAYDGTSINPIIQINNTHQHVNITSNLNVASNLNTPIFRVGIGTASNIVSIGNLKTNFPNTKRHSLTYTSRDNGTGKENILDLSSTNILYGHPHGSRALIFLDIVNGDVNNKETYTSGIQWKPNYDLYSKVSAYIQYKPDQNFFRGDLVFGTSNAANKTEDATERLNITRTGEIRFNYAIRSFSKTNLASHKGYAATQWDRHVGRCAIFYIGNNNYVEISGYLGPGHELYPYPTIATDHTNLYFRTNGKAIGYVTWNGSKGEYKTYPSFTGQHRSKIITNEENFVKNYIGMIVISSGQYNNLEVNENKLKPTINESLPIVELSKKKKEKSVFGVLSNVEDSNSLERTFTQGNFVSVYEKENDDNRVYINSLGEGAIWIVNTNGNLENGDYIQSSDVIGHGEKQTSEFLANYTVAKITMDCDFDVNSNDYDCIEFVDPTSGNTYRKAFVGCTYHCG